MSIEFSRKTHTYRFVLTDDQLPTWRKCKVFEGGNCHILNVQFGLHLSSLKMVSFNILCHEKKVLKSGRQSTIKL
jgi:hypothetical protein